MEECRKVFNVIFYYSIISSSLSEYISRINLASFFFLIVTMDMGKFTLGKRDYKFLFLKLSVGKMKSLE